MTTLFSNVFAQGIELEQNLRQGLESAQSQFRKELESRGLRLSPADLAALVEEWAPAASRAALSGALDFLRPFTAGLGLRVSRLSDTQIEMVVPDRTRNLADDGCMHEGVMITAGIEAAKLLWSRHAPLGAFEARVTSFSLDSYRRAPGPVRVRLELLENMRENLLSRIRETREASSDLALRFVDEAEQSVADMTLSLTLKHTPALEAPTE